MDPNFIEISAQVKRLLRDCKDDYDVDALSHWMMSPPDLDAFQMKMNALFDALFHTAATGFASTVWHKTDFLLASCCRQHNACRKKMSILRAIEFFCKTAMHEAVEVIPVLLAWWFGDCFLMKYQIMSWYQQGSTGPDKENPIWKSCESFIKRLELKRVHEVELSEAYLDQKRAEAAERCKQNRMWLPSSCS